MSKLSKNSKEELIKYVELSVSNVEQYVKEFEQHMVFCATNQNVPVMLPTVDPQDLRNIIAFIKPYIDELKKDNDIS